MHQWQLLMSCTLPTPKYAIYLAFLKGLRVENGSFGLHISFVFGGGGGVCVSVCVWGGGWSHLWDEWLNIYYFPACDSP
jgi:hypothetical protein